MNHDAWETLRSIVPVFAATRPDLGRMAVVMQGKRAGVRGTIFWHGKDRFSQAGRYMEEFQRHLLDVKGSYGFRVGIESNTGERFFVAADKVLVCIPDMAIAREG
jgi:hypothetical protein